jgi:UDP-GlcNAc:undecaprenyl-phosphate GlcNAc-1-phosphate transferase
VAKTREDRWHTKPTALMGGVAIFAAFSLSQAAAVLLLPEMGILSKFLPLFSCGLFVFLLGLADDIYGMSPQHKLVGQIVAAAVLVFFGFKINWFTSYTLNTFVSILWVVGITNAFNLLDNMDGLAAGIAFISAFFMAGIILVSHGFGAGNGPLLILVVFMGALVGFLVYNFYPASIFMGDSGSLFIGFMLAGTTAHQQLFHSPQLLPIIMVPLLIVFIPIWDTMFVSIMRTLFGRSVARGGKDHSSHRMVAIGLPEGKAVLTLYAFSVIGGSVALVGSLYGSRIFFACLFIFLLVSLFFWIFLAKVRVYPDEDKTLVEKSRVLTTLWIDFTYKRRMFEVILDLCLVSFAYWVSYFLRYEGGSYGAKFPLFLKSLPIVLACLMMAYFAFGIYRGVWRYTSVAELIVYLKAVTVGAVASLLVSVFLYRFDGFSRTVFVIFWGISLLSLAGSRLSFRLIAELVRRNSVTNGRRTLIYGAGDKGEFALREIVNNPKLGLTPVGFIDDDVKKHKRKIQGYKVLGGRDRLVEFIPKHRITQIIVASGGILPENIRATCAVCAELGVTVRNLELSIKQMAIKETGTTATKGSLGDTKQSL